MIPGLPTFLHGCEIKSGSGLETKLVIFHQSCANLSSVCEHSGLECKLCSVSEPSRSDMDNIVRVLYYPWFGVQIVSSICEHLCSICERSVRSANRVRRPNMSSQTELSVCTPNSAFALRTQRLHSEREGSLTELTVCTPNLSVRRPNSVCKQTKLSICRPNSVFGLRM